MEKIWYYAVCGERRGPVTLEELRAQVASGAVGRDGLVWQPAFGGEWRPAGQVRELFEEGEPPALAVPLTGVAGMRPSCLAATAQAWNRMVALLFRPFDMSRWFSIGFCAWLSWLGAGGNTNGRFGNRPQTAGQAKEMLDHALDAVFVNPWETGWAFGAVCGVALVLFFSLLFCMIRSRGDFMFLHRWYQPGADIGESWRGTKAAGDALFRWRVGFFAVGAALYGALGWATVNHVVKPYLAAGHVWSADLLLSAAWSIVALVMLVLTVETVAQVARDFVVPVMYWRGVSAGQAWRVVFALCNQRPFAVTAFYLLGFFYVLATVLVVIGCVVLTCCVGFILLVLPYIGSVVLLPATLFFRGYSVCFISQWRPDLVPGAEGRHD